MARAVFSQLLQIVVQMSHLLQMRRRGDCTTICIWRIVVFGVVLSLFGDFFGSLLAAEPKLPAERFAVILHTAANPDGPPGSSLLLHGLMRNGYQCVTIHDRRMPLVPATELDVRAFVNAFRSRPNGAELLLFYQGPFVLKDDGSAWLGQDDQSGLGLDTLRSQLYRLESEKFSVAMLMDVDCKDSLEKIKEAVAKSFQPVKPNLHVLIGRRESGDLSPSSSMSALLCRALTFDREVDGGGNEAIGRAELEAYLKEKSNGAIETAYLSSPNASSTLPFIRLLPSSSLEDVIENLRDELAFVAGECGATLVAIPDFEENGQAKTSHYSGPLTPYITESIRRRLSQSLGPKIEVIKDRAENSLPAKGTAMFVAGTSNIDPKGMQDRLPQIILDGTIDIYRDGKMAKTLHLHEGKVSLNVDEAGMSGHVNMSPKAAMAAMGIKWTIEDLDSPPLLAPHPMTLQDFPLRVYLATPTGERLTHQFSKDNRRMHVKISKGEEYAIVIENHSARDLFLRLLVDGRNTLPDRLEDGGTMEPAAYVNLARARCWFCEAGRTYRVTGFYTQVGSDSSQWKAFSVANVNEVAARGEQREALGIITAAFYEAAEKSKSAMASQPQFATCLGTEGKSKTEPYTGNLGPGTLIGEAPINIHYGFAIEEDQ